MFTFVETFFLEVNIEVSNFYQFCPPLPGFYGFYISNLTCKDCLIMNWLLIKKTVYTKYWTLFSLSGGMPNTPVSFTVTFSNNSSIKKWWKRFPFSVLPSTTAFLSRLVSHVNNSSKTLVSLTKFGTEKHTPLQLALNL